MEALQAHMIAEATQLPAFVIDNRSEILKGGSQ